MSPRRWFGCFGEDRVGLRARERCVARDCGDAAEVVALVEVERAEHLVGGDRHGAKN